MNESTPVLEARNIVKKLGEGAGMVVAVKGVDIALYPGELALLMGPSGSGKTTLISILGCILSPTSGTVSVAGTPTAGLTPDALARLRRTHIGYIFQSYNLFPTLTAVENVRIALDVAGIKGAEAVERAKTALVGVGLGHRLNNYPANMSGGEKQRVAVARAIATEPSIVLADEPTAALDGENGHGVMRLLSDIAHTQRRSILVVTHDPRTLQYADRVIQIEDGRIVSEERGKPGQFGVAHGGRHGLRHGQNQRAEADTLPPQAHAKHGAAEGSTSSGNVEKLRPDVAMEHDGKPRRNRNRGRRPVRQR